MESPEDTPAPRLCHIIQWPDFDGFGFNLHAEKNRTGQFIGKVDESSPAELAGLQQGDRIVEVNDVNIANENHKQVVARIKAVPKETRLLVVDETTDKYYKSQGIVVKTSMKHVTHMKTPIPRPGTGQQEQEQSCEIIETRPPTPPQTQSAESVDEESGESVRKFDDGDVKNGPCETTTSESEEKELSDKLSQQDLNEDKIIEPPSSVSNDDSSEVSSEKCGEKLDTNENTVMKDEQVVLENNESFVNMSAKDEQIVVENNDSVMNMKNDNSGLDTEDGDYNSLDDKSSHTYIEDELKKESPSVETPTCDKYLDESPRSSRSSEHRETPPTTPTTPLPETPEPVLREKEKDFEKSNGHTNGRPSSGLNLNMSAQEMREMLAQRKKKDVRKEQVDMRTKYMMIQKM